MAIHLFNDVFIEIDHLMSLTSKAVVVSEQYAPSIKHPGQNIPAEVIECVANIDELTSESSLHQFLLDLMDRDEKVVIFADNAAFSKIYPQWVKSTTNLTQDEFNFLMDCHGFKSKVFSRDISQLVELCKAEWTTCSALDFSSKDWKPSFEFMFASALINRDFAKKTHLQKLMSKFIKREYELLILEARRHLDTYILDKDMQTLLGGSGKDITNYHELPRMSVYAEPFFYESVNTLPIAASYLPGKLSKIDISKANDEQLTALLDLTTDIEKAVMGITGPVGISGTANFKSLELEVWKYLDGVKAGQLSEEEYNSCLDDIIAEIIALIYIPLDQEENILFILLPYLKSLYQTNELTKLQKFTLK